MLEWSQHFESIIQRFRLKSISTNRWKVRNFLVDSQNEQTGLDLVFRCRDGIGKDRPNDDFLAAGRSQRTHVAIKFGKRFRQEVAQRQSLVQLPFVPFVSHVIQDGRDGIESWIILLGRLQRRNKQTFNVRLDNHTIKWWPSCPSDNLGFITNMTVPRQRLRGRPNHPDAK